MPLVALIWWHLFLKTWVNAAEIAEIDYPRLSGFATLGFTYNDNDTAGVRTTFSQHQPANYGWSTNLDSVIGLQLDWQPLVDTSITLQSLARQGEHWQPQLRMGYLRQQLGNEIAIRFGRLRIPVFLDSDIVEIGYAYPMVRQPTTLYSIANSVGVMDGIDIQWRQSLGDTGVLLQGYYGKNKYQHRSHLTDPDTVGIGDPHGITGIAVKAMLPDLTLYAGYSQSGDLTFRSSSIDNFNTTVAALASGLARLANHPLLAEATQLALAQRAAQIASLRNPYDAINSYKSVGIEADLGAWHLQGEWMLFNPGTVMIAKHEGFHLMASYRMDDWMPYLSLARLYLKGSRFDNNIFAPTGLDTNLDTGLSGIANSTGWAHGAAGFASNSISLGVRWDWREDIALKLQYDYITTPNVWSRGSLAVYTLPFDNEINLITIAIDIIF